MPKQLDPRRFELIVTQLALGQAKTKVIAQIRADDLKLGQFSCAEINAKRDQYFASHMEGLINQALVDIWAIADVCPLSTTRRVK